MPETYNLFNLEVERNVLGACILKNEMLDEIAVIISGNDFYRPQHRQIYEAMTSLWVEETPIDLMTLNARLEERNLLDEVGGAVYTAQLATETVATPHNAKHHARIVRDFSIRRQLVSLGTEISFLGKDITEEPEAILEKANERLYSFANLAEEAPSLCVFFDDVLEHIETGNIRDYQTGYKDIDDLVFLRKGNLIILAAETGVGKTTFALDLTHEFCKRNCAVLYISLEMNQQEVAMRYLARLALLPFSRINNNTLSDVQKTKLAKAVNELKDPSYYPAILTSEAVKISNLNAYARRFFRKNKNRNGVLVVDFMGLLQCEKRENRAQEVAYIARQLKVMAQQLDILVLAPAQLNRGVRARQNARPELWDLRDSGEIEQAADGVWFLYRPNKQTPEAELLIKKNRNGKVDDVKLFFLEENVSFGQIERKERNGAF